ncbi:MAG: cobyrinate a,c-diamide synthase [Clostridiales bacterium]|nr:cobyrinate a,c-diamide synthase [Clostridiales bacterium]
MQYPRILIGAAKSGSGKTLITCAMLLALCDRGRKPAAFKCGPDYIDPMFHRKVLGVPSKNMDTFFTGETVTRELFLETFREAENPCDVSVVEGVMGLYDGLGGIREEGSAYHLAKVTKTPVILVLDAGGMGKSILAVIAGFLSYDTEHLIKGVILNRTSKTFFETIRPEIEREFSIAALGYFPKQDNLIFESRHLGLKLPGEIADIREKITCSAEVLKETVDMDALLAIAEAAEPLESLRNLTETDYHRETERVKIAVAYDEAFCFYYEDNLRLLEKLGAEIVYFSPVHDRKLPEGISALLLGGGYPELYAKRLAENETMKRDIREKIRDGMPTIAECGGFMYLHETLKDKEGRKFPMTGVIPGVCSYRGKLVRFGYVELAEKEENFLPSGENIKGHEFHYFDSTANGDGCLARKPVSGKQWDCVWDKESCWFGFPHLYYYSNPSYAMRFLKKAKNYRKQKIKK